MAGRAPAAMELVTKAAKAKSTTLHKARLAWQSYVLQEAEATARYHKMEWCATHGKEVLSLQHDGIVVNKQGRKHGREAAEEMSRHVETAARYPVRVKHEALVVVGDTDDDDESEWDMPPLTGPVDQD
jgi:hypothetical protein